MAYEPELHSDIRPLLSASRIEASAAALAAAPVPPPRKPPPERGRYVMRALAGVAIALLLAWIGYEAFLAPHDEPQAWTPPAGLSAEDTPYWLKTLCADRTPELCAAADRARTAEDCDGMRAGLRALEAADRKLSARGSVSGQQRWVLLELYAQGTELCQFQRTGQPSAKPK